MPEFQREQPTVDIEKDYTPSGFQAGLDTADLSYGEGILNKAYSNVVKNYPDYKDYQEAYDAFSNVDTVTNVFSPDDIKRKSTYEVAIRNNVYQLDDDGNMIPGEGYYIGADALHNKEAIHGALLAKRQGFGDEVLNAEYSNITKLKAEELAAIRENASGITYALGTLAGHVFRKETLLDFTSPGKIMGKTILGGAVKAAGVETVYAAVGEVMREQLVTEHMERAGLEHTLWDSVENILIGAGLAGSIRGIGSAVSDVRVVQKIDSKLKTKEDKDIFERFARRENYKLTNDTRKHISLVEKAREDLDNGKNVDVSEHTDVDINTKTDEVVEETVLTDEALKANPVNQDDVEKFDIEYKDVNEYREATDADPYEGMVDPKEADELINEMADLDPEIKAEMEAIQTAKQMPEQAQKVKEAAEIPVGGSEDQAKQVVQDMFNKSKTTDDIYKDMSKAEIEELDNYMKQDAELMAEQKAIEDEINAFASDEAGVGGTPVFAQFGAELFGGAWNGINYDEDTGTFTFDPIQFMVGFLGGHLAKKIATNPKLNAIAKKEALAFAQRTYDKLKDKPIFNYITGTHRVIDDAPGVAKKDARTYFKEIEKELGLETFDVFETGDELRLNLLIAPKGELKQGKGTKAMEKLVQYADKENKRVTLSPALPDDRKGTTSRARLVKFYKRFGFVENKGRNKDFSISDGMYREPKGEK